MGIKNGPIVLTCVGENKYQFISFPDQLRGRLFYIYKKYNLISNKGPAYKYNYDLHCPGLDKSLDSCVMNIPLVIAKDFLKIIEACNKHYKLTPSHYIKRLPR